MRRAATASVFALALAACSAPQPSKSEMPSDALSQMSIAFEGQPSRLTIKPLLDDALDATGTPVSEETYRHAGDVLVTLRKKNGTKEMSILKCVPSRVDDPRIPDSTFPSVAAVCSVDIVQGDFKG